MLQNSSGNFGISLNKRQIDREAVEVKGRGEEDKDIVVEEIFVFLEMFLLLLKKTKKNQHNAASNMAKILCLNRH